MMKFSERIGKTEPRKVLQVDEMSAELRNSLWNLYFALTKELKRNLHSVRPSQHSIDDHIINLWIHFFKLPIDQIIYDTGGLNNDGAYTQSFL